MCEICHLILRKLIDRGLVSKGNVLEQQKEIMADLEVAMTQLTAEDMKHIAKAEQRGFDA